MGYSSRQAGSQVQTEKEELMKAYDGRRGFKSNISFLHRYSREVFAQEGIAEKENNGYVVFKWNIQDQLGNRVVVRGGYSARPHPYSRQTDIFKDDVNGFSSTSDIFFMAVLLLNP
jgi:hypothetical protein